ncbi:hypothetical protein [Marinobacterium nitratireducens]|nr:hypothetical protein [Marinobacterium nitratireducens]
MGLIVAFAVAVKLLISNDKSTSMLRGQLTTQLLTTAGRGS